MRLAQSSGVTVVLYTLWRLLWSITVTHAHTEKCNLLLFYTIKIQMDNWRIFGAWKNKKKQVTSAEVIWRGFDAVCRFVSFKRSWSTTNENAHRSRVIVYKDCFICLTPWWLSPFVPDCTILFRPPLHPSTRHKTKTNKTSVEIMQHIHSKGVIANSTRRKSLIISVNYFHSCFNSILTKTDVFQLIIILASSNITRIFKQIF